MTGNIRTSGFRELDRALGELPKASAKAVLVRVAKKAGQPVADHMMQLAPDDPETGGHDLKNSIFVGTRLNKSQTKAVRKEGKFFAEVYIGTNNPAGMQQEFGNINHSAQSFGRPAWDAEKHQVLKSIGADLGKEIAMTAKRVAAKRAKG